MCISTKKQVSCPGARPGRFYVALALAVGLALALAPAGFAAGDPVKSGTLHLKLSGAFKKQLKRNDVRLSDKAFSLKGGSINPITGAGEVTLKGRLRFKHGRKKAVYKKLTATLDGKGLLKGTGLRRNGSLNRNPTKLFRLRGGSVTRNGFGAKISSVKVKFLQGAARKINRRLDLDSLRRARAGSLSISEQPQTVEVTGGSVRLIPNPDISAGSGTIASKFIDHCINGLNGATAISPAIKNPPAGAPSFDYPVTGGTLSPQGTDGEVQLTGGLQLANTTSLGGCGSAPARNIQQTDFAYNLLDKYISAHVVVNGPPAPLGGDQGVGIGSNLDTGNVTVSADPDQQTVTINGVVVRINGGSALFLNQTFMQPSYDASMEFASGDLNGIANLLVSTR